eukprot:2835294-Amphidinium_carterae.1
MDATGPCCLGLRQSEKYPCQAGVLVAAAMHLKDLFVSRLQAFVRRGMLGLSAKVLWFSPNKIANNPK